VLADLVDEDVPTREALEKARRRHADEERERACGNPDAT